MCLSATATDWQARHKLTANMSRKDNNIFQLFQEQVKSPCHCKLAYIFPFRLSCDFKIFNCSVIHLLHVHRVSFFKTRRLSLPFLKISCSSKSVCQLVMAACREGCSNSRGCLMSLSSCSSTETHSKCNEWKIAFMRNIAFICIESSYANNHCCCCYYCLPVGC